MKFSLCVFFFCAISTLWGQSQTSLQHKADSLILENQFTDALEIMEGLLSKSPDNVDYMISVGKINYYLGRYDEAELHLKKVIELTPEYLDAYQLLTSVYMAQERYFAAEEIIEAHYKQTPENHDLLIELISVNFYENDYQKALYYAAKYDNIQGIEPLPYEITRYLYQYEINLISNYEDIDIRDDWRDALLNLGYRVDTKIKFGASVEYYNRFNKDDYKIGLSAYLEPVRNSLLFFTFQKGISSEFLPDYRFDIGYNQGLPFGFVLHAGYSYLRLPDENINLGNIGIEYYIIGNLALIGKFYFTEDANSTVAQVAWYGNTIQAMAGTTIGNEIYDVFYTNDQITIQTTAIYATLKWFVTHHLGLQALYEYRDREDSYKINKFGLGFVYRY